MVDVSGIQLPWVPWRRSYPRLGNSSSSDVALEAAAATSITDLFSTGFATGSARPQITDGLGRSVSNFRWFPR